jgi:cytochrome c oxidase cbb3-type subunit II
MTQFRSFVLKLLLAFAAPWLLLVAWPALVQYPTVAPVKYDKDSGDELDSAYSYPLNSIHTNGAAVYASEGCVQCHTQVIRDPGTSIDGWKKNWGANQEDARPATPARGTTLRDYLSEHHAYLGIARNGPDLANAGYRFQTDADVHMHIFAPKARKPWSTAPAYKHLYTEQPIQGQGAANALPLRGTHFAPKAGYEVVPTPAAEQLVTYIRSLKRDYALPVALVGKAAETKK